MAKTNWDEFLATVKDMRKAQKEYFRTKSWEALSRSKELEKAVDGMVKEIGSDGKADVQPELFG